MIVSWKGDHEAVQIVGGEHGAVEVIALKGGGYGQARMLLVVMVICT